MRHQELEVFPLHILRGLAQHEMGAVRRIGATLVLTKTGRLMADDEGRMRKVEFQIERVVRCAVRVDDQR